MFKLLETSDGLMLVNFDHVVKIVPRPRDGNHANSDWEVAMFHLDERRLHPKTGESVWVGTYEVIFKGSKFDCESYVKELGSNLDSE